MDGHSRRSGEGMTMRATKASPIDAMGEIKSAQVEKFEGLPTLVLTLECADEVTANLLFDAIGDGLRRGQLVIRPGKPMTVDEAISGGVQ